MKRSFLMAVAIGVALLFPIISIGGQATEELTKDKILATPEWQPRYDEAEPDPSWVNDLKPRLGPDMKIDVYLGLWCPDSRNNVPPFMKFVDRLGTGVPVRYFGVPRKASRDVKYYVEEMKVEKVPTFIFYRNGKEIGRIVENPKSGLIEDIMEIVFK